MAELVAEVVRRRADLRVRTSHISRTGTPRSYAAGPLKRKVPAMRKHLAIISLAVAVAAMPLTAAVAAAGVPQRGAEIPPGLMKALTKGVLVNAIMATEDSNSRLQDLPVSP